jgi:uncharacterized protein YybS (DUF2232 family)
LPVYRNIKLSNILGCIGAVLSLLLISAWLPIIGPLFSLLLPLPFLFYSSKLGLTQGLIIGFITIIIIGLIARFTGYPEIVILCIEFASVGFIIGWIFSKKVSFGLTILLGTASMLLIGTVILVFIGLSNNSGPIELILEYLKADINKTIVLYEEMGLEPDKVVQLKDMGEMIHKIISRTYPSLIVIGTGFVVWINVIFSKPLFRFGGLRYPNLGRTDIWQAPEFLVWGVIAAGFSLFLPSAGIKFIALNALVILAAIYVFHGLSIIMFFFNKHKVPTWIRVGTYSIILIQQIFLVVLALGGLFDQWIDFRKLHKKVN